MILEHDIGPLGIESNAYIINKGIKNLTKLAQEKDSEVIKLKKESSRWRRHSKSLKN